MQSKGWGMLTVIFGFMTVSIYWVLGAIFDLLSLSPSNYAVVVNVAILGFFALFIVSLVEFLKAEKWKL